MILYRVDIAREPIPDNPKDGELSIVPIHVDSHDAVWLKYRNRRVMKMSNYRYFETWDEAKECLEARAGEYLQEQIADAEEAENRIARAVANRALIRAMTKPKFKFDEDT